MGAPTAIDQTSIDFMYPGEIPSFDYPRRCSCLGIGSDGDGLYEFRHSLECHAILHVIDHELSLPILIVGILPPHPPYDTLDPRCPLIRPGESQALAYFLESVRVR